MSARSSVDAMHAAVDEMAKRESFKGYGPEQGYDFLVEAGYYLGAAPFLLPHLRRRPRRG